MIKIQDIATLSNGINFGKSAYTSGIKLIGVSDFKDRMYPDYNSLQEVDAKIVRENDFLHKGDIVFVRSNGNKELVGRCMMINQDTPVTFSGFCIRLRLNNTQLYNPTFFTYLFKSNGFRKAIAGTAVGANIQNLSQGRLGNYEFECPNIKTQHRIATTLSRYDSLIDNYQKQIKLLEEAAQRLYKEWFAQNNNLETIKLVDISSKITDGVHNTVYNEEGSPYKLLSCKNVVGGHLMISSSERSISKDTFEKLRKRTQLEKGDILVSTVGSVGEVVYLDIEPDHFEFQRSVGIIKADKNVITPLYVYYSLLNRKNELKRTAHGAAQQCLFISDLKNFEIPIGSKEQIQNFEHFAKPISERITNARHQLRLLTESRDRLLPKLLSGEIEV